MRQRTRKCPLCGVYMTSKPNRPNSKHLDHILPRNQGGNHVHGNVRIICADCNLKRPKDGSDYTGTLSLWAQGPVPVARPDRRRERLANKETCRKGLHPWLPANIKITASGKRHCKLCRQAKEQKKYPRHICKCGTEFAAPGRTLMCPDCMDAAARKAAELHASGLTWDQVAAQVGYGSGTGAMDAAKRTGYVPAPKPVKPKRPCPDCGTPKQPNSQRCEPCTTDKAWRAVDLQRGGATLRAIADELGYDSITTVTNLMATVVTVSTRMQSRYWPTDDVANYA